MEPNNDDGKHLRISAEGSMKGDVEDATDTLNPYHNEKEYEEKSRKNDNGASEVVIVSDTEETKKSCKRIVKPRTPDKLYFETVSAKEQTYLRQHLLSVQELEVRKVECTSCSRKVNFKQPGEVVRHPDLGVPICRKCYKFYNRGEWIKDEDGYFEMCRWCANGGEMKLCDGCHNVFCQPCIRRNLGEEKVTEIEEAEEWQCLVCRPQQIWKHRAIYFSIWTAWKKKEVQEKVIEKDNIKDTQKTPERDKKKDTQEKTQEIAKKSPEKKTNEKMSFIDEILSDGFDVNKILGNYLQKANKSWTQKNAKSEGDLVKLVVKLRTIVKITHHNLGLLDKNLVSGCVKAFPGLDESRILALTIPDEQTGQSEEAPSASTSAVVDTKTVEAEEEVSQKKISQVSPKVSIQDSSKQHEAKTTETDNDAKNELDIPEPVDKENKKRPIENDSTNNEPQKENKLKSIDKAHLDDANKAARAMILQSTSSESDQAILADDDSLSPRKKLKTKKELDNIRRISVAKTADDLDGSDEEIKEVPITSTWLSGMPKKVKCADPPAQDSTDSGGEQINILTKVSPKKKTEKKKGMAGPASAKKAMRLCKGLNTNSDESSEEDSRHLLGGGKLGKLRDMAARIDLSSRQLTQQRVCVDMSAMGKPVREELSMFREVSVSDHKELRKAKRSRRRSASPEEEEGVDSHIDRLCNLATLKRSRKERESEEDGWAGRREAAVEREAGPKRERVPAAGLGDMSSDTGEEGSHCNRDSEPESPDRLPEQSLEDLARAAVIASSSDDNARVTSDDSDEQNESPLKLKEKSERKRKKSNSSEGETRPKSKKLSLLSMKLSESDSSEDEKKYRARMEKRSARVSAGAATKHGGDSSDSSDIAAQTSGKKKKQQRRRKILVESGHEESSEDQSPSEDDMPEEATKKKPLPKKKKKSSSSDEESDSESDETLKKRKRGKDGSDSGENKEDESPTKRHNIKKLIKDKNLAEETKTAAAEERERRKRVEERKVSYNNTFGDTSGLPQDKDAILDKLVLDFDPETKKILVEVNRKLVKKLKPHQANGIKFMWESVFESVSQIKAGKMPGGAILAHCMGLGKTLQSVSLAHTVMTQRKVALERVMVICPVNVVKNWQDEFHKWLPGDLALDVTEMSAEKDNWGRADRIDYWYKEGGVLLIGYDMFRNLTKENNTKFKKKQKEVFHRCLLDPGPQLVICDEGHLLKNEKSAINKAVNRIKTPRRIILTGTPLQNNLKEYYEMVNFVKPNLMGTRKEFMNRFVNPIVNGQHSDSTDRDVNTMKKRSFILNDLIKGCMQRLDYNVLVPYLMPKQEYVIMIQLTDFQKKLYRFYLENYAKAGQIGSDGKLEGGKKGGLFYDVQNLSRVWNHPYILKLSKQRKEAKEGIASDDDDDDLKDFINDEDAIYDDEDSDIQEVDEDGYGVPKTRPGKPLDVDTNTEVVSGSSAWWNQFLDDDQLLDDITLGSKMVLLMDILKECALIGDKVLVFSQSILSLNLIEDFLGKVNDAHESAVGKESAMADYLDTWIPGKDYYRMDGSTPAETRKLWCKFFNRATSHRMRLFLISTKAGGLGINLVAANRVIIFDASWNPSHDVQSIFRVFRFGQTKPVYVYRFLAKGTMEEKIYDRQVTKQSLAARVVDEQQIESHFTMNELAELYEFNDEPMSARPTPVVPEDRLLAEVVDKHKVAVWNIHKHDSLLENKVDENLTEEERKAAWDEYEQEKTGLIQTNVGMENLQQFGMMLQTMLPKSGDGRIMASPINPMAIQAQLRQMNPELSHEELVTRTRAAIMQLQNMHRTQTPVMVNKNTLNVGQRQTTGYDQSFYQAEMAKAKAMIQQQYPGMYRFRGPTPPGAPSMPGPGPNYMQQMQMMRQQRANSPSEVITLDDQPPPHAGPSMARGRGRGGRGGRRGRPRLDPDTDLDFSPEPSALSQQEMIARLQQSGMQVTSKAQAES